jgi:hypothetical protein
LRIPEREVTIFQIDGPKRQVQYISKLRTFEAYIHSCETREHKRNTSTKKRNNYDRESRCSWDRQKNYTGTNSPPEVSDEILRSTLTPYGKVVAIRNETWSHAYWYVVANGIRQITILTQHIPSHLSIAGHMVLLSYEGQPQACYGCSAAGHMYPGYYAKGTRTVTVCISNNIRKYHSQQHLHQGEGRGTKMQQHSVSLPSYN